MMNTTQEQARRAKQTHGATSREYLEAEAERLKRRRQLTQSTLSDIDQQIQAVDEQLTKLDTQTPSD
jgi:prefoldin subunit 5